MSARIAGEHSPIHRDCGGVGGHRKTTSVSQCTGVGGLPKTPSPWTHCGLCRLAATGGGVWVLLEEHRILEDDFKKKRFLIQRVDWFDSGHMLKRSHIFYVEVDCDLVVVSRRALFHALVFSTLQTTSDSLFNQNTEVVAQQVASDGTSARAC